MGWVVELLCFSIEWHFAPCRLVTLIAHPWAGAFIQLIPGVGLLYVRSIRKLLFFLSPLFYIHSRGCWLLGLLNRGSFPSNNISKGSDDVLLSPRESGFTRFLFRFRWGWLLFIALLTWVPALLDFSPVKIVIRALFSLPAVFTAKRNRFPLSSYSTRS